MTDDRLPLAGLPAKTGDAGFLHAAAEAEVQLIMEADVEGQVGAARHERTGERLNHRNGFRDRTLDTRPGLLALRIPGPRQGGCFPPFLEPRKTSERALVAVIQEAWIGGASIRRVDELVQAIVSRRDSVGCEHGAAASGRRPLTSLNSGSCRRLSAGMVSGNGGVLGSYPNSMAVQRAAPCPSALMNFPG